MKLLVKRALFLAIGICQCCCFAEEGAAPGSSRTNHIIPDLKLELIWAPPGSLMMGSPPNEPERNKAEGPQTQVTLTDGFWLAKTEITQAQYEAVTGVNPSAFKASGKDAPVERVSWTDSMAFCEKLNERERVAGRLPKDYAFTLPTEAQWEYAYRAGTTGEYPGDPQLMAWHAKNSGDSTHPVAQKRANAWGFYDMPGNVLEWTLDWYGNYPGGSVTNYAGPRTGYYRTARGGSWRSDLRLMRSAARSGGSQAREDYTLGFRVALSRVVSDR
ncbi:MAG TPA: formylglycine-generating enzyme family protein [Verrucomicrobiae bacterium]|nr:formylglycine-generating enzyme family protein [Verrucomicrobiae bacterium]